MIEHRRALGRGRILLLAASTLASILVVASALTAQEEGGDQDEAAASPVEITAVEIEPSRPGVDTLCQLRVRLESSSERAISALDFGVAIGGVPLEVYEAQLFLETVEPGRETEVRLYNFWTTETGRPAPAGGKLEVEVTLRAAQWVEITTEDDGTEVWTLGEAVPGLPVSRKLVVPLKK